MRPTERSDEARQRHESLDGGWRGHSEWIAVVIRLQKKWNMQVPDMFLYAFHLLLNKLC